MEVGNCNFCANFDSGNLLKVEEVGCETESDCDAVFNIWASPDCHQTKYQVRYIDCSANYVFVLIFSQETQPRGSTSVSQEETLETV